MHGASATLSNAAAVFRAGDAQLIPENPEKRHLGLDIHVKWLAIDYQSHRGRSRSATMRIQPLVHRATINADAGILVSAGSAWHLEYAA
jgi:hypothetical protein